MQKKWKINVKSHKPRLNITSLEGVLSKIYYRLIKTISCIF
jgi:hypothetical protein